MKGVLSVCRVLFIIIVGDHPQIVSEWVTGDSKIVLFLINWSTLSKARDTGPHSSIVNPATSDPSDSRGRGYWVSATEVSGEEVLAGLHLAAGPSLGRTERRRRTPSANEGHRCRPPFFLSQVFLFLSRSQLSLPYLVLLRSCFVFSIDWNPQIDSGTECPVSGFWSAGRGGVSSQRKFQLKNLLGEWTLSSNNKDE